MKNGKFYESDYEEALIDLLEQQGWTYTYGRNIARNNREVLISDDLSAYLKKRYRELNDSDIEEITNHLRFTSGQTHFELLRNTFHLIRDGYRYTRTSDGKIFDIGAFTSLKGTHRTHTPLSDTWGGLHHNRYNTRKVPGKLRDVETNLPATFPQLFFFPQLPATCFA